MTFNLYRFFGRFFHLVVLTLSCALFLALPAHGQAADNEWFITDQGKSRLLIAGADSSSGNIRLGIEFSLKPGWKIYWRTPGDAGAATSVTSIGDNIKDTRLFWPIPTRHTDNFDGSLSLQSFVYQDHVILPVDITPSDLSKPLSGILKLSYAICKDICLFYSHDFPLEIATGYTDTEALAAIDAYRAKVPTVLDPNAVQPLVTNQRVIEDSAGMLFLELDIPALVSNSLIDIIVEEGGSLRFLAPKKVRTSEDGLLTFYRIPLEGLSSDQQLHPLPLTLTIVSSIESVEYPITVTGDIAKETALLPPAASIAPSFLLMLLYAFLGGLILNAMPCVLPVLSLKLLGIIKHGGASHREARKALLISALGIITSFLVLAGGTILVKLLGSSALGWGIQFQHPVFILALVLVLFLFAFNLLGWFEIRLPGNVADKAVALEGRHRGSLLGHFFSGVLATLLATPCTAPFLGVSVGFALSSGIVEIVGIFFLMGVGMAFPYLLLAMFPALVTRLPKPGAWMVGVKKFLAVLLLITAGWLIWVLSQQLGSQSSKIPDGQTEAYANTLWQAFDEQAIPGLVASGKIVIVDVTADWCVTCKANKFFVMDREDVRKFLHRPNIVMMQADITSPHPEINTYIAKFNRYGIPFNAVYGPKAPQGIVLDPLLTRDNLYNAVKDAGMAE